MILSMVALMYVAKWLVTEFENFSQVEHDTIVTDYTDDLAAQMAADRSMRYEFTLRKVLEASAMIAKQAAFYLDHKDFYGISPLTDIEAASPPEGASRSAFWGQTEPSSDIVRQMNGLSHLDPLFDSIVRQDSNITRAYVVTEMGAARFYPAIPTELMDDEKKTREFLQTAPYAIVLPENDPSRQTLWSELRKNDEKLTISAVTPVYGTSGGFWGISAVDIDVTGIFKDIYAGDFFDRSTLFHNTTVFVFDSQGNILAFPQADLTTFGFDVKADGSQPIDDILPIGFSASGFSAIRELGLSLSVDIPAVTRFDLGGKSYLFSYDPIQNTPWSLGVLTAEVDILSPVSRMLQKFETMTVRFISVTLLFLVGSFIIAVALSVRHFFTPADRVRISILKTDEDDLGDEDIDEESFSDADFEASDLQTVGLMDETLSDRDIKDKELSEENFGENDLTPDFLIRNPLPEIHFEKMIHPDDDGSDDLPSDDFLSTGLIDGSMLEGDLSIDEDLMLDEEVSFSEDDILDEDLKKPFNIGETGTIEHSYSKMVEALQKVNELEKKHSIELASANRKLQKEIEERKRAEKEIRHLSRRLLSSMEDARKSLAQDLHDEFGQTLTALHFGLEGLTGTIPSRMEDQRIRLDGLTILIEQLGDKIRNITSDLRPDLLDDLGLIPTLDWYIEEFRMNHEEIEVEFQAAGFRKRLPPEMEIVIYRIFQEGLNNVVKHAKASHVNVTLTYSHPQVIFILKDDGVGFDETKSSDGIGLLGMRERVDSVKGIIDIRSVKNKGTTIRVELPINSRGKNE